MTKPIRQFAVITDGGMDSLPGLHNAVHTAPFSIHFGDTTYNMQNFSNQQLYQELIQNPVHPTSSQPTPQDWAEAIQKTGMPNVLAITISDGLSGSRNALEQALELCPNINVSIYNSRTISAAQAFQVHIAETASEQGKRMANALDWLYLTNDETHYFFTIETLDYLRRGGRIGNVAATLGGLLNLKPIVTVDKLTGTYINATRARSYKRALTTVADHITKQYGEGQILRVGLVHGSHIEDAHAVLDTLRSRHPIHWSGIAPVNPVLSVHVGPRAMGIAVAPGPWPWETSI